MITGRQFNEITSRKRNKMASRCKPRYWKSGKRAGQLRTPGRDLPFSLEQFRAWAMEKVGLGAVPCFYCPRAIDILSFEPDHHVPLDLGGGYGLDNLVPSCEDCNRMKDAMPPHDFIALMQFLDEKLSRPGAANVKKRLRAGSMGIKTRWPATKAPAAATQAPIPTTQELDFSHETTQSDSQGIQGEAAAAASAGRASQILSPHDVDAVSAPWQQTRTNDS